MEEEIIIPEEEVFNYQKLRYILNKDGYVCHASLGGLIVCDLGECTEYNGDVPEGYETIDEWYEEELEKLNSWKVVDGNLVFDPNRYEVLQSRCEKEHEDNRYVCHKEISNLTNLVKSDNADVYLTSETASSNLIEVTDSNKFASTYIEIVPNQVITNKVQIKFNNGNLLTNDATSKNESGISFEVNADRTIYINGTATNDIEYDIGGYSNNTKPILAFKKGINYYLSSNGYQIKMYRFDGTDRTEIYSGNGGVINFTDDDKLVTQIVLVIPNTTNANATISPMLNVGDTAKDYITYEGNDAVVYLGEYALSKGDCIEIENGTPILQYGNPIYLDAIEMPSTYLDLTYMYCMEDLNLKVTYPNKQRNNDLTGYETPNGAFAIDDEGNMYCNNATITGGTIDLTSPDNVPVIKVTNSDGRCATVSGAEIGMISSDYNSWLALSNFEGNHPYLALNDMFEDGGGSTNLSSTGLSITSDNASIKVNGVDVAKANIYSTEEQRIGTWIDGKPLYRKVFYSSQRVEAGARYMPNTAIPNIEVVTDVDVTVGAFGYASFKNHWSNDGGTMFISTQFDKDSGLYISADYTGFIGWVLKVEYTKTTD